MRRMVAALLLGTALLSQNLVNGSFETGAQTPDGWKSQTWAGQGSYKLDRPGQSGERCVLVESVNGIDGGWQTTIHVRPYSKYRLTAYIKTEGVVNIDGQGATINLHGRPEHTTPITGAKNWTQVAMDIQTGADDVLVLNCLLGYFGRSKGKAWFDSLDLIQLETRSLSPRVEIDAAKKGEPISPYIYSQFIEHMGRCIYGGIWAEMLEDRKFFFAVEGKDSPWITPRGKATMAKDAPFVGDHTPVVDGEIAQGDLWIQKDRKYVGYAWLKGEGGTRNVTISLGSSSRSAAASRGFADPVTLKVGAEYVKVPFQFTATNSSQNAELGIGGDGPFRVGCVSLMPADNVRGMRRDTLALLKELDAPLYRWPGGNFVSGYEWRDGIGDRDRRPTRKNPAWQGIEANDFGTHEFLDFCKEINTEPLIVVNAGFGDAYSGAKWLEYVNGAETTEEGRRRSSNGQKAPWAVKWWGIGNEMYGDWQLGHMPIEQYMVKHNMFFDRMMKVDPTIKTIASSDIGGDWSKKMLENCSMTLISEHFYCQERPGIASHVAQVPNAIRAKAEAHRKLRAEIPGLREKNVKIAMDEWNYWYGPHIFGELGTRYYLKDGLGIAAGLHEFYRCTDVIEMAQYAQTVNVIGAIKTTPTEANLETTGLVLKLYRKEFGTIPLVVGGAPMPLDVMAALTADGRTLTIGVVNPTGDEIDFPMVLKEISIADSGDRWEIANPDPMIYNDPMNPHRVKIEESKVSGLQRSLKVKAYSATLVRVAVK